MFPSFANSFFGTRRLETDLPPLVPQFTQILDILKTILDHLGVKWVILTGMTKVDERQSLVDEFTNDSEIKVFLLSTLAGGMGINLTAASVVVV